jgi:hypothetical protein
MPESLTPFHDLKTSLAQGMMHPKLDIQIRDRVANALRRHT